MYFCVHLLNTHGNALGPLQGIFRRGLDALVRIQDAIKSFPTRFPDADRDKFAQDVSVHLESVRALGMSFIPKHHMLVELAARLHDGQCAVLTPYPRIRTRPNYMMQISKQIHTPSKQTQTKIKS